MLARLRYSLLHGGFVLLTALTAWAQTTTLEGNVKDAGGQPLKGAVIKLDRTDIKGHYQVKSDKKGHWLYTGLPFGTYDISCEVEGKVADKVSGVKSKYGDSTVVDFDLAKSQQQQAAAAAAAGGAAAGAPGAAGSGEVTQEQARGMSKEQKAQYEAQLKQRSEAMKKNKALNDAFNLGQDSIKQAQAEPDKAKKATLYQAAVDNFNKAGELDANQVAVWDSLGEAYAGLANTQTGDERTKSYDQAIDAYKKGLALKPDDAAVYNQMGNIYGAEKKIPEATEALTKAAQLNPQMASKAYFNMGANLVNTGSADKASEFFKKATDADPSYAEAWYQLGSTSMMKGAVDAKSGKQTYPPETGPALQKYLELQPSGTHAQEATAMLQAMGEQVQTKITNPAAKKKK
jgi:tetratricopeptide (TPR) repeat protein